MVASAFLPKKLAIHPFLATAQARRLLDHLAGAGAVIFL